MTDSFLYWQSTVNAANESPHSLAVMSVRPSVRWSFQTKSTIDPQKIQVCEHFILGVISGCCKS